MTRRFRFEAASVGQVCPPEPDVLLFDAMRLVHCIAAETSLGSPQRGRRRARRPFRAVALRRLAPLAAIAVALALGVRWIGSPWLWIAIGVLAIGVLAWVAIAALRARRSRMPALPQGASVALLPEHTQRWLEHERRSLPFSAQASLDAIARRLDALNPQLREPAHVDASGELQRLLGEELPELVSSYRKLPSSLTGRSSHLGASPERQLIAGLAIIDAQLARLHQRLAARDLEALATHLRYLDLKYGQDHERT